MTKMIVPESRIPKSVNFLRPGVGGWLPRIAEYMLVDGDGVPYLQSTLNLQDWQPAFAQSYNNPTMGWVYKDEEGQLGVVVYFMEKAEAAQIWKYRKATQAELVGRDPLVPLAFYKEYLTNGLPLKISEPGKEPVPQEPVKESEGSYKSRF